MADVISDHTAGDPMQDGVIWTYLTQEQIAEELAQLGTPMSPATVQNLLDECEFSKRKAQRRQSMGLTSERNEQFRRVGIAHQMEAYLAGGRCPPYSLPGLSESDFEHGHQKEV